MKLSNSFRRLPPRSAAFAGSPRDPAKPANPISAASRLHPQATPPSRTRPKAKNADTSPPPPHREGDEAVDTQGQTQPTRKPIGVAVGERASRGTDFRCQ